MKIQGERRQTLAQMIDIPATLLEYFRFLQPTAMQGTALINALQTDLPTREAATFGVHGGHINITDGQYIYMRAPASASNSPLFEYTLMPTHMRDFFSVDELQELELAEPYDFTKTMKTPAHPWINGYEHETRLYDLKTDPDQDSPINNPEVEARFIDLLIERMKWNEAPLEQFQRMGLLVKDE